jgi:hypothetical protein
LFANCDGIRPDQSRLPFDPKQQKPSSQKFKVCNPEANHLSHKLYNSNKPSSTRRLKYDGPACCISAAPVIAAVRHPDRQPFPLLITA